MTTATASAWEDSDAPARARRGQLTLNPYDLSRCER